MSPKQPKPSMAIAFGIQKKNKKKPNHGPKVEMDHAPAPEPRKPDNKRLDEKEYMADHFGHGSEAEQKMSVSKHEDKMEADDIDDHYESIADAILAKKRKKMADGGEVSDDLDIEKMDEDDDSQKGFRKPLSIEPDSEVHMSVADEIMAKKRKKMADGGMVDIDENEAEVDEPNYDDQNMLAAKKENYSEIDDMDQPEDSNLMADSREEDEENEHDMISSIMKKIKSKKSI